MSEAKQDQLRRGIRLTRTGASSTGHPYAGPISPEAFASVSSGDFRLAKIAEPPVPFASQASLDAISLALQTSGFEGIELPELESRKTVDSTSGAPVISAPESTSIPTIIIPRSPAPSNNVYEAIEFLDFDEPIYEYEADPEPEPAPVPPPMATDPLTVPVRFASPTPAKLMQGIAEVPMGAIPVQIPEIQLQTLRRKMITGANPNKPAPKPEPVAAPAAAPAPPPPAKPAPQVVVRSTPAPAPKQTAKPAAGPQQRPAAAAKSVPEPVKAAPIAEPKPAPAVQEKPKVTVRPPEPARPAATAPSKPAIAARDHGNAVPVQREPELEPTPAPAPAPKPKLMPIRKPDAAPAAPVATSEPVPMLGMGAATSGGLSPVAKAAIAVVAVIALGGGGYFAFSGSSSAKANSAPSDIADDITAPGMVMGGGGWTTTWGADAPHNKGKQIAIYRPSMAMTDYRFEFRGHIERKALGWIFRAADPKNYYVMKLEMIKPGSNPIVALIKYAVINGKETTRTQVLLPFENLALDTVYQVRFEARGDKFTTYVQNKLVDYWTDNRVKVGGAGLYNDIGERGQIKSSQVSYLVAGK